MKSLFIVLPFLSLFIYSCGNNGTEEANNDSDTTSVVSDSVEAFVAPEYFLSKAEFDSLATGDSLYVIIYASELDELEAAEKADTVLGENSKAGYVNGDDFESLENGKYYLFVEQSIWLYGIANKLERVQVDYPEAYVTKLNDDSEKFIMKSKLDITIGGKSQPIMLVHADPKEENEYFSEGGEDWMWRQADLNDFFAENHPEVLMFSFYNTYYEDDESKMYPLPSELEAIYKDLDLDEAGFGWIMVKDGKYEFVGYGAGVEESIVPALRFFGYEVPEDWLLYWE